MKHYLYEEDEIEMSNENNFKPFPANRKDISGKSVYTAYIWDSIDSPIDFINIVEALNDANEGDIFNIHLQTPGGSVFATDTILLAIEDAQLRGVVVKIIGTGRIASAGTFILLSTYEPPVLSDNISILFHGGSINMSGTVAEFKTNSKHMLEQSEEFFYKMYKWFFTEEEITAMLDGKDICMNSEEFYVRWEVREEELNKEYAISPIIVDENESVFNVIDAIKDIQSQIKEIKESMI